MSAFHQPTAQQPAGVPPPAPPPATVNLAVVAAPPAPGPADASARAVVAPPPLPEEEHVQRMHTIGQVLHEAAPADRRRGSAWQQPRPRLEQPVHHDVLDFCTWAAGLGLNRQAAAARLGLAARTVRAWTAAGADPSGPARPRGRPVVRSPRERRQQVLELLASVGPGLGLPSLQGHFNELPRAERRDRLRRYRRVWIPQHHQALPVLHWQ